MTSEAEAELEALRNKVAQLETAVDLAVAKAMENDDVEFAETLTEMAES